LNYGTLSTPWIEAMILAGKQANKSGIPVVLDPVGAGATRLRTETGHRLLRALKVAIVRGNAGEVGALRGSGGRVKGAESVGATDTAAARARNAPKHWNTAAAVTCARDVIPDGQRVLGADNGHAWLPARTCTGCAATAVTAAFA